MAKTKTKIKALESPRPKTSPYLCCFGISSSSSLPHKTPTKESNIIGSDHDEQHKKLEQKKHRRWFSSWESIIGIGVKSKSTKTVPIEGSELSQEKEKVKLKSKPKGIKVVNEVHHHSSKLRSKSNLHNKTSQQPNTIPPPPRQKPQPVIPDTPNQTPSHSQTPRQNSENNNIENDTCQKSSSPPTRPAATTMSHVVVSLPTSKRQVRRLLSSLQAQPQTTPKRQSKQHQNAKRSYNGVVGASVVMVTLVIMILWGRFCAIVCTSVWLYFVPRFRLMVDDNDVVENAISNDSSNDLDLDSVVYKKKVVLEGLLERNHSTVL